MRYELIPKSQFVDENRVNRELIRNLIFPKKEPDLYKCIKREKEELVFIDQPVDNIDQIISQIDRTTCLTRKYNHVFSFKPSKPSDDSECFYSLIESEYLYQKVLIRMGNNLKTNIGIVNNRDEMKRLIQLNNQITDDKIVRNRDIKNTRDKITNIHKIIRENRDMKVNDVLDKIVCLFSNEIFFIKFNAIIQKYYNKGITNQLYQLVPEMHKECTLIEEIQKKQNKNHDQNLVKRLSYEKYNSAIINLNTDLKADNIIIIKILKNIIDNSQDNRSGIHFEKLINNHIHKILLEKDRKYFYISGIKLDTFLKSVKIKKDNERHKKEFDGIVIEKTRENIYKLHCIIETKSHTSNLHEDVGKMTNTINHFRSKNISDFNKIIFIDIVRFRQLFSDLLVQLPDIVDIDQIKPFIDKFICNHNIYENVLFCIPNNDIYNTGHLCGKSFIGSVETDAIRYIVGNIDTDPYHLKPLTEDQIRKIQRNLKGLNRPKGKKKNKGKRGLIDSLQKIMEINKSHLRLLNDLNKNRQIAFLKLRRIL